jgi:hydrogenase large subunit
MSDIYLPLVIGGAGSDPQPSPSPTPIPPEPTPTPPPVSGQRIVIDPLTRIEGHLRIEARVEQGQVQSAYSSSTMFRGIEVILQGRDPREAWMFAQRVCGVCTTVHAIASVRAVENALGIQVPDNARLIRNLIEAAQFVQDHVIHFYHLHALDWVDIVSALSADPNATSQLARSISDWHNSSPEYFTGVKGRLQGVVDSGQLGLFANGYWGHPAYKLPPEGNLLAVAHYLEALDWQQQFIKIQAILGGKNPHPQSYLVGGMAIPVHPTSSSALNRTRIQQLQGLTTLGMDFVNKVYLPDLKLIASFYKDWAGYGAGAGNYLSYGDFPDDNSGSESALWLPRGVIFNQQISQPPQSLDPANIHEYIKHSWYSYQSGDETGLHPSLGETSPGYSDPQPPYDYLNVDQKYSWLKAPRYQDQPMEVGPLARMLVAYAAGHNRVIELVNSLLTDLALPATALLSTLGRVAARGVETVLIAEKMSIWINELETNMNNNELMIHDGTLWNPATWPAEAQGWGTTEAPRGGLGHWVTISNGKIANYQMVVPSTWNGSPRDAAGLSGPWEQALAGTPIADENRPLEILRTIHSFDPCMACSVHLLNATGEQLGIADVNLGVSAC